MPDFVRRIVSGPKARYVDPKLGYDLDLVYVTDRLIIMGWPASSVEALYRNRRKDVRKFLNAKHGEHYRIYNLCPCTENTYDADDFNGAVSRYPFPDHHPPPLSMIPMFVADMTAFFAEDPNNVAVIHCKAGKGRSGTMACSYLLSLPILPPFPQSSRNIGNKHDRKLLHETRKAQKEAAMNGEHGKQSEPSDEPKNGQMRLNLPSENNDNEEKRDRKMEELTARLDAVFEFHTSRRLKPSKGSSASNSTNSLQDQKSGSEFTQLDDSMAPTMARTASDKSSQGSPLRPRKSLSNLVGSITRKASSRGFAAAPKSDGSNTSPPHKLSFPKTESQSSPPRLTSKSMTNLRALGISPAGTSRTSLGDHLEPPVPPLPAGIASRRQQGLTSWNDQAETHLRSAESLDTEEEQEVLSSYSQVRSNENSPKHLERRLSSTTPSGISTPEESDMEVDMQSEDLSIPRLAVSIPSQRRWVGYWARMLAGMDPRAALDSSLMHPSRRQVKIVQIYVDRRATSDNEEGHLSVQIARYNEQLVDRLETWERGARRRQRAFGALDPGAPSPNLSPSELEGGKEEEQRALQKKDEEKRWRECEKRNREHREEYNRMMRQHGNDTGVGQWGINVMAEREMIRPFHWDDDKGGLLSNQMETVAMVSEHTRFELSKTGAAALLSNTDLSAKEGAGGAASILRYVFEPSEASSTHYGHLSPQMTWTKPSAAIGGLGKLFQGTSGQKKREDTQSNASTDKSISTRQASIHSPSNTSNDTWPSQLSTTPPPTVGAASSTTSADEYIRADASDQEIGVIVDADREVQLRVLIGRSGSTHAKLPDILSAGYLWFIPAFETPMINGKTTPKKGQRVRCQFGVGEIDFRKGKKAAPLMGGGDIRSITVEFEWVEVGWHEADDEDTDDN